MRGSRPVKARKITPKNTITSQYGQINSSILQRLQATLEEDPLQDLTPLLESMLLIYQRSLKKLHVSMEPAALQNVASTDARPTPRKPKSTQPENTEITSAIPGPIITAPLVSFPQYKDIQKSQQSLHQVNIRPQFQSYVRDHSDPLEWEELFTMIPDGEILWELFSCKIVKITETVVVKMGRGVDGFRDEVELMEFVNQSTSIPLPEVFGFHYNEDDECFIFMSYIEGCTLESIWPSLGLADRETIESQLAGYFAQLRALPCPNPVTLGSLATGICRDARRIERQCPSITSEHQFNEFIGKFTFRRDSELAQMLLSFLKDNHRIVLTHGDLQPRNILVQGNTVAGIIDWELGGWYPEYWEYVKGAVHVKGCEGWWRHLGRIIGTYPMEWAIDLNLDPLIINSPIV